jgi:uncharacterized protein YndB with AHSA1/START domain
MKHLGILENAGLIIVKREGKRRWNYINAVPLREIYERWVSKYQEQWAESLVGFKRFMEAPGNTEGARGMNDFHFEHKVNIQATPEAVWSGLANDIGKWWSHSFNNGSVSLDPHPGGQFMEQFPDGKDGALYATVTYVEKGKKLSMSGPMGMSAAVFNVMHFTLEPAGDGTVLTLTHRAVGQLDDDLKKGYSEGWVHLLENGLKQHVENLVTAKA